MTLSTQQTIQINDQQKERLPKVRPQSLDVKTLCHYPVDSVDEKSTCSGCPSSATDKESCCSSSSPDLKQKRHFIGGACEAPSHIVDTKYITHGYRCNYNSIPQILRSMFQLHHEWFNIWSHFAGFLVICFLICFLSLNSSSAHTNTVSISNKHQKSSSLLDRLPSFDNIETVWRERKEKKRNEKLQIHQLYTRNLDSQLWSTINNVETFVNQDIKQLNSQEIDAFLATLKFQVTEIGSTYHSFEEKLGASFNDYVSTKTINQTSSLLQTKLDSLKKLIREAVNKLDSSSFDWIDIYKYINVRTHTTVPVQEVHRWPIFVFLFSAAFCLMCSTIFHSCNCMQENVSAILRRVDYAGISILITGSAFPLIVYGFYCQPYIAFFYGTTLSVLSIFVFVFSLGEKFHSNEFRKYKGILYASLGILASGPGFHLLFNEWLGGNTLPISGSTAYYFPMGGCYLGGLFLYVKRIPERFVPGKVNNCGHSHNFWHIFTLLAMTFHYLGCFENYYTRLETACPV